MGLSDAQLGQKLLMPLGMIKLKFIDVKKFILKYQELKDKIFYGESVPSVGDQRLSFARFMDLLKERKIKRINLLADGRVAILEIPNPGFATNYETVRYDRKNVKILYGEENKEYAMERLFFYVHMPGDLWENSDFMKIVKENIPHRTADNRVKFEWLLNEHQVHNELFVRDPADSFQFLSEMSNDLIIVSLLLFLQITIPLLIKLFGYSKKDKKQEAMEKMEKSTAIAYNLRKGLLKGKKDTTGVEFKDVAGVDKIKGEVEDIIRMMLGDHRFNKLGAKVPKGLLLEGPPGTGKTYLAKAMAGEAALPFFSANGAEFVEMFSGIAASRVQDLFKQARANSPSIIFIDEIDAIGSKRRENSVDPGTSESEAGLLQLLVEMDGVQSTKDQILVIGATNRVDILDDALLRPGRFDRVIYMGNPVETNRYEILKIHADNKPINRDNDDYVLKEAAKLTQGFSSAELSNLLNEAAILSVRKNKEVIDLSEIEEVIVKMEVGLAARPLPDTKAKHRFARIMASKAVASALTPGQQQIQYVTIRPQGSASTGRIVFQPGYEGTEAYQKQILDLGEKINAVRLQEPLGAFEYNCEQLLPLMVGRACEEVFFPPDEISMVNQEDLFKATQLTYWLCTESATHPVMLNMLDNYQLRNYPEMTDKLQTMLLDAAYKRAIKFVQNHVDIINEITEQLLKSYDQKITGSDLVKLIEKFSGKEKKIKDQPLIIEYGAQNVDEDFEQYSQEFKDALKSYISEKSLQNGQGDQQQVNKINIDEMLKLSLVISGVIPVGDLVGEAIAKGLAQNDLYQQAQAKFSTQDRLIKMRQFSTQIDSSFSPPPPPQLMEVWERRMIDYNVFNLRGQDKSIE